MKGIPSMYTTAPALRGGLAARLSQRLGFAPKGDKRLPVGRLSGNLLTKVGHFPGPSVAMVLRRLPHSVFACSALLFFPHAVARLAQRKAEPELAR